MSSSEIGGIALFTETLLNHCTLKSERLRIFSANIPSKAICKFSDRYQLSLYLYILIHRNSWLLKTTVELWELSIAAKSLSWNLPLCNSPLGTRQTGPLCFASISLSHLTRGSPRSEAPSRQAIRKAMLSAATGRLVMLFPLPLSSLFQFTLWVLTLSFTSTQSFPSGKLS